MTFERPEVRLELSERRGDEKRKKRQSQTTHDREDEETEKQKEEESTRGGRQGGDQILDTKKVTTCMEYCVKTAAVPQYVLSKCVAPRGPQALSRFVETAAVRQYVLF